MLSKEFQVFSTLFEKVYYQAFHEELGPLPQGKAQLLSWAIQKRTGEWLDQQCLQEYVEAIFTRDASRIYPTASTLGILVSYTNAPKPEKPKNSMEFSMCWYAYRGQSMAVQLPLAS